MNANLHIHLGLLPATTLFAFGASHAADIVLSQSNGSAPLQGIEAVNRRLLEIGVRVSQTPIPQAAKPTLRESIHRALSANESQALIQQFRLDRQALLEEIREAGRSPTVEHGGLLQTSEHASPPYPKVYDMQALKPEG